MGNTLADLVKAIAVGYTAEIEKSRFEGLSPKALHARTLRLCADRMIDSKKS